MRSWKEGIAGLEGRWLKDLDVVRTKRCGPLLGARKGKWKMRCGFCKREGHTRGSCVYTPTSRNDESEAYDDVVSSCDKNMCLYYYVYIAVVIKFCVM